MSDFKVNKAWISAKLYYAIKQFFVFDHDGQVDDFESDFLAYSEAIGEPCDRISFYFHTCRLVASLNNGHTVFFDNTLSSKFRSLPFWCRLIDNQWVVVSSWSDQIMMGDVLRNIDDRTIDEFFEEKKVYISGSNDRFKKAALLGRPELFEGVERFSFEAENGREVSVAFGDCEIKRDDSKEFSYTEVAEGVWHLQLNSFARMDISKDIISVIKSSNMRSIIVDVRRNGGGAEPTGLMDFLIDEPYYGYTCKEPVHFSVNKAYWDILKMMKKGEMNVSSEDDMKLLECLSGYGGVTHLSTAPEKSWPRGETFEGRVVVLAGPLTGSAAEDFVLPFTQIEKIPVIGEATCGSTGQIAMTDLGEGMGLWVGARRAYCPDGSRFEGVGFAPDIEVIPTVEDIRKGRDPVLARAVEILS